ALRPPRGLRHDRGAAGSIAAHCRLDRRGGAWVPAGRGGAAMKALNRRAFRLAAGAAAGLVAAATAAQAPPAAPPAPGAAGAKPALLQASPSSDPNGCAPMGLFRT